MKINKTPMRRCVGCMVSKPKSELIRIVADEGKPAIDPSGKMNGRGVYLCADTECFEKARKRKAIQRGLGIEGPGTDDWSNLQSDFERRIN